MSEANSAQVPETVAPKVDVPPPVAEPHTAAPPGNKLPLVLALIALGLSALVAVAAFFIWNQQQQMVAQQAGADVKLEARLQPLHASLDNVDQKIQTERKSLEIELDALGEQQRAFDETQQAFVREQQGIGHRLSVLSALIGRSEQGWSLAEIEYLLRIAIQRLDLQRDVASAQVALQSADERLRDLADPHYQAVREQIARDLDALRVAPKVDVGGVNASLNAWLERIDDLPVAGTRYEPAQRGEASAFEPTDTAKDLKSFLKLVWSALSNFFQFREHDRPVGPMLAPENEYFLRENMRLQLSVARLALLRDDVEQYRASLTTAQRWAERYFDVSQPVVGELSAELSRLAAIDIRPQLPNLSASLRVLRQQMKLAEPDLPAPKPVVGQSGARTSAPVAEQPAAAPEAARQDAVPLTAADGEAEAGAAGENPANGDADEAPGDNAPAVEVAP